MYFESKSHKNVPANNCHLKVHVYTCIDMYRHVEDRKCNSIKFMCNSDLCTQQPVAIVTPVHGHRVREPGEHVVEDKERGLKVGAVQESLTHFEGRLLIRNTIQYLQTQKK